MKTLVTGATGFLGTHLLQRLCDQDKPKKIRVLARKSTAQLEALGVDVAIGSVDDPDAVMAALEGVKQVYHLAGFVSRKPADARAMYKVHVEGTRLLCRAAVEQQVSRIVMASTSGTVAVARTPDEMPDEDFPPPLDIIAQWPYY